MPAISARRRHPAPMNDTEKRRAKRRRKAGKTYRTVDIGDGMEQATPGRGPPGDGRAAAGPRLAGDGPQRDPHPAAAAADAAAAGEPFRVTLPPGIPTGFGIDIGPAFLVVGRVAAGDVADRAGGPRGDGAREPARTAAARAAAGPRRAVAGRRARPGAPVGRRLRVGAGARAGRAAADLRRGAPSASSRRCATS